MDALIQSIFNTEAYPSRIDQLKANFLYTLLSILTILGTLVTISGASIVSVYMPVIGFATIAIVYGLVRSGYLQIAGQILIGALFTLLLVNNLIDNTLGILSICINMVLLIIAGFTIGLPGIVVIALVSAGQVFYFQSIEGIDNLTLSNRAAVASTFLISGFILHVYNRFILENRREGRDVEGAERLKLAEVNMRITRQASARESMDNALNSTLELILQNYPQIYHAQVFLLDDDGIQARLRASTGSAGEKLMERNHSLAVGSLSVIGQTTFTGEPVVARVGDKESVHRVNELLPDTILEAAFPLRVGEDIIGALDLQSRILDQLTPNDRLTFQSLANSLALAIDSIRQFEQAKARVNENQRLAAETRSALREVERLNQRLIGRAWTEYVKDAGQTGVIADFVEDSLQSFDGWTNTLAEAARSNNLVQEDNILAVPLKVRGQVVGAMEFELEPDQDFTPEDLELIMEVSERFGLAAENTRLVEASQRSAQRATLINQITSRFQSAQNVEATLAEAARSLSDTLGAGQVKIRLGVPENTKNGKES